MAQYLKDDVQQRILDAALFEYAHKGYQAAKLADIAAKAGVSAGNVYRYYSGKQALYDALVPPEFVRHLTTLLHRKIDSLKGVQDARDLASDAPFSVFSQELMQFSIQNRLRVVLLLNGSAGTTYAHFGQDLVQDLAKRAIAHFRHQNPKLKVSKALRFTLTQVYEAFLATHTRLMLSFQDPKELQEALTRYAAYHLVGMKSLFQQ